MIDKQDRPILLLDFDGTVHRYSWGWRNGDIYDPIVPGFFEWAQKAKNYFRLVIYSSRTKDGTAHMETWLRNQWYAWVPEGFVVEGTIMPTDFEFAHEKPPAFLTIDDRAIQFRGDWSSWWLEPEHLRQFKPWNQGDDECAAPEPQTAMRAALTNLLDHYTTMIASGDCGSWNPEVEDVVIAARKVLAEPTSTTAIGLQKPERLQQELKEARDILSRTIVPPAEDGA
jgi:hypothetical protein